MFSHKTIKFVFAVLCAIVLFTCVAPAMADSPVQKIWVGKTDKAFGCPEQRGVRYTTGYKLTWDSNGVFHSECELRNPNLYEQVRDSLSSWAKNAISQSVKIQQDAIKNSPLSDLERKAHNSYCVYKNDFGQCIR